MIEEKIIEIQKYFKEKIKNWDFEIWKRSDNHSQLFLKVDWKYIFDFQIHFEIKTISQYTDVWNENFFILDISQKFWEELYEIFDEKWFFKSMQENQRAEKIAQFEKLKKELNIS